MDNIIVLGDSFCSSADHWPAYLAGLTNHQLVCYTDGAGQSWWDARNWLTGLDPKILDNADIMVFVHTNSDRIPSTNKNLGRIDHSATPVTEADQSIQLYYKYIHDPEFLDWAQQQWFKEISTVYSSKQLVHLHSFKWSMKNSHHLLGLNITTDLAALSLNELGSTTLSLVNDQRPNHLNEINNRVLASQLAMAINKQHIGNCALDVDEFQQKTRKWLDSY